MSPNPGKVREVKEWPTPKNKTKLESFLGLINFNREHLYVVDRPLNEWMTDNILTLKAIRRKNELIWRKTRTTITLTFIMIVVKL